MNAQTGKHNEDDNIPEGNRPPADAATREKALDISQSFIVQAPAGSGKTELLIQRYLKLLAHVEYPEQILAITFTRKAAGEMKNRVVNALDSGRSAEPPDKPHERSTWQLARQALNRDQELGWNLLDNPARLKIQTIDSFCAYLTRQMPLLSKLGGPVEVEESVNDLYFETARRVLEKVEEDTETGEHVRNILKHLDNSKTAFLNRLVQLLEKRDQWLIPFFEHIYLARNPKRTLEETLENIIESNLQEALATVPDILKTKFHLMVYAAENLAETGSEHPAVQLADASTFPTPRHKDLPLWIAMSTLLLKNDGDYRKTVNKNQGFPANNTSQREIKQSYLELLGELRNNHDELREMLNMVTQLPSPRFTDAEWTILTSSLKLLPVLSSELRRVFLEKNKTDFTEIALSALEALGKEDCPTDLMLYLDHRIHHILVDEYQDTSYKQEQLLIKLTAGWQPGEWRTLFIVGDPMQSIYRFRDAEVGLFLKTRKQGIGDNINGERQAIIKLGSLTLETNFRSQKNIVDWVNNTFRQIFPAQDNQDLGAITYAHSTAHRATLPLQGVVFHPYKEASPEQEAEDILRLIQKVMKEEPQARIGILVRARNHLVDIIRKLRDANIRFKAEEIDRLTERPAVLDLLSLMNALLDRQNRLAWLSILRAPWCGLSLEDLHQLCWREPEASIWDLLINSDNLERLSPGGRRRVERLVSALKPAIDNQRKYDFRDLLEGCWIGLGGPACLDSTMLQDVEVFLDEVSKVLAEDDPGELNRFAQRLDSLYANPTASPDIQVEIMTIHKAKGLEFDYVILPGLGKKSRPSQHRLVFWMPHGDSLLMAPIQETGRDKSPVYEFLRYLDRAKEEYEVLRLLYVACTRAKQQLHLFGHVNLTNNGFKPAAGSLLQRLWPILEKEALRKLELDTTPSDEPAETKPVPAVSWRLPEDYQPPPAPPSIRPMMAAELDVEEKELPSYDWAGNTTRCLGKVLHRCFQSLANGTLDFTTEANELVKFEPRLRAALSTEGVPDHELDKATQKGIRALQKFLEDSTGQWILREHTDGRSEYPLTGIDGAHFVNKVIDRTFIDEHGIRWIIDFKTGLHEGGQLEKFFKDESERYRPQLEGYKKLFRDRGETRPIKLALYFPFHQKLVEIEPGEETAPQKTGR